jgi:hypothetical protein
VGECTEVECGSESYIAVGPAGVQLAGGRSRRRAGCQNRVRGKGRLCRTVCWGESLPCDLGGVTDEGLGARVSVAPCGDCRAGSI